MGCKPSSHQTVTQTTQPPPEYMAAYQNVLGQAQNVAGQPLQQYGGNQVADFTPAQQQAFGAIDQAQGAASPFLQQANQFLQQASSPLWSNVAQFSPGATQQYQPGNVPSFGDISQYSPSLPGFGQLGNYAPNLPQFSQQALQNFLPQGFNPVSTINPSSINFSPQQFSGSALSQYESPYTHDVVNATQAQFANQNAQQANQLKGNAAAAGAFGGDREAVMQSQLANQQQLAQAPIIAGLENQGFQTALGEFNTQQQTGLQAQQATADARLAAQQQAIGQNLSGYGMNLQGYGQGLAELNQQQQLALQGYGAGVGALQGQQQLGLQGFGAGLGALTGQQALAMQQFGTGLGEFNTQQQQQLAANEANAWLASQAGFGSMNLASQAQNLPLGAASAQLQSGALQQQLSQEQLNIPYEQFLQQQAYPFQTTSFLANIAEGLGSNAGGTASTTQPQGSLGSTLGGLGLTGLALNNMGLFGGSGGAASSAASLFGSNPPIAIKHGGKVIPFRKGGGMIPQRAGGGGLPYEDMFSLDDMSGLGIGGLGHRNQMSGSSLMPDVPNVDVNIVPQTPAAHGSGPPRPPAAEGAGGASSGGMGDLSSMMSLASMFGGGSGGGSGGGLGGLFGAAGGGSGALSGLFGAGGLGGLFDSIGAGIGSLFGAGAAGAAGAGAAAGGADLLASLGPLLLLAKDGGAVRARGGMIPRRADGGANDNDDDIEPIQMTAPAVSRTQMLGDNYGFSTPPAAKITPQKPDINMALLAAGLGMMGGKSTNMFENLGQGALLGLKEYQGEKAQNQTAAEKQAQLDEEHNRDTISTQEAKTRAAQLADDMDQRRVQQFNQQSNADRSFFEQQKRDAQTLKNENEQRNLQQQELGLRRQQFNALYGGPNGMGAAMGAATPPVIDDTSGAITAQTGLSLNAFRALTGQSSQLPRDRQTRNLANAEAERFANKNGVDVSTFASQYDAYNKSLASNIMRNKNTRIMEQEVLGTLSNLYPVADKAFNSNVNMGNVLDVWAGKQVNDPLAQEYATYLDQLRTEVAGYFAATAGRTGGQLDDRDYDQAARLIANGITSKGARGLQSAIEGSTSKMNNILDQSEDTARRQVWDLFGVGKNFKPKHTAASGSGGGGGPPAAAIQMLRSNPAMRGAFDLKYGVGAAASVLGN